MSGTVYVASARAGASPSPVLVVACSNSAYLAATREFLDRHVFYDGHYLGVEFLTAMLEDYARPRPMTAAERTAFLSDYFYRSGFIPFSPTPIPAPTLTLTPIALPQVPATPTP